jgi:SAM-dependent methyltransferase
MPEAAARGFGATADLYEARRPTYPETAIGWLTTALGIQESSTVVDLGAGTGKLTRRIAAKTPQVLAVEPLAAMSDLFAPLVEEHFAYDQVLDPEGVVELMASRSFIAALDDDENRAVREEIRRLLAEHPETAGRGRLVLPYRTDAYWTRRLNL